MKFASCALVILAVVATPSGRADESLNSLLETAAAHRREGNLRSAIELLEPAKAAAHESCIPRLSGELAAAYYQAHRFAEAAKLLEDAYRCATVPVERARLANDLGNLAASRRQQDAATRYFEEARGIGQIDPITAVSAALNLLRFRSPEQRLDALPSLSREIDSVNDLRERARLRLNFGAQARLLGEPATKLAFENLDSARAIAEQLGDRLLLVEALDNLSQLYEDRKRSADALKLVERALALVPAEQGSDLFINLHWRRARLLELQGEQDQALLAYQRAVEQIEEIREDIPIEYVDGRSSFRDTLEPIYLRLADLLLRKSGAAAGDERHNLLRRARETVDLLKQSELEDYLGERCTPETAAPLSGPALPAHVALFYPVMLNDRLELLVETRAGIESYQVNIDAATLRNKALSFAKSLREARLDYLPRAKELYGWLLEPLEGVFARHQVKTIVLVPDGPLRLFPVGALHDGERFVVAKYDIAIAPGLGVGTTSQKGQRRKVLLAGMSEPGGVVEKLPRVVIDEFAAEDGAAGAQGTELRKKLALPSVVQEIQGLRQKTQSSAIMNSDFTVERLRRELATGAYRFVHIASHAMFSQRAETSFIMAYDDILTIDDLQKLLQAEALQSTPIEMLTLSACQTAEGDDRAPLGIAGAVLKARANSALGSLWPVADEATTAMMVRFYELMTAEGLSKSKALQRAQIELSQDARFQHPYYWSAFILVGNWQ